MINSSYFPDTTLVSLRSAPRSLSSNQPRAVLNPKSTEPLGEYTTPPLICVPSSLILTELTPPTEPRPGPLNQPWADTEEPKRLTNMNPLTTVTAALKQRAMTFLFWLVNQPTLRLAPVYIGPHSVSTGPNSSSAHSRKISSNRSAVMSS